MKQIEAGAPVDRHACPAGCNRAGVSPDYQLPLPVDHLTKASREEDRYWDSSSSSRIESPFPRKMPRRAPAGLKLLSRPHSKTKLALGSAGAARSLPTARSPHRRLCMTRLLTSRSI